MRLINLDLLLNPLNWFVVVIIIMMGLFLVSMVSPQE